MKREIEYHDLLSLERELRNQNFRYQLALKDGAVGSVIAEVNLKIAKLEEKIRNLRQQEEQVSLSSESFNQNVIPFYQNVIQQSLPCE